MRYIADFHIHSKYSRATARYISVEKLDEWAKIKGIQILGTGDFTHPLWFKELKEKLEPIAEGIYGLKFEVRNPKSETNSKFQIPNSKQETGFILTTEFSCIYTRNNKVRRIHLLVFAPSLEIVEKINKKLGEKYNLKSDGRPILGLDAEELTKILLDISPEIFIVPAHCLLPDTIIHTKDNLLKPIQDIRKGDFVITHKNRWRRVTEIFERPYNGKIYYIKPRNFSLGLITTPEHPFYAIKTHKNCHWSNGICKPSHIGLDKCKNKYFKDYKPEWLMADQLERGDVLIYPRFKEVFNGQQAIDLKKILEESKLKTIANGQFIVPVGSKITAIKQIVPIDKNFCRLAGYYLAEGYTNNRDVIGFAFSEKEKDYVKEVMDLMRLIFGFNKEAKLKTNKTGGIEILFYSKILCEVFKNLFYFSENLFNASTKALPIWALGLSPDLQVEIFRCWWRGDAGYTASRLLTNQMKIILLRLGIIPSIYVDKRNSYNSRPKHFIEERKINARYDMYSLNKLSFYEDKFNLLQEPEFTKVAKYNKGNKYGWIEDNYIYLPIYDIKIKNYEGKVYNLEVEEDNSYVCEFATVHNCWTPWFSIFGSKSGFNSVEECFGKMTPHIFALETGLSSDPPMNWRWSYLDKYTLISNSDAHSPQNLGREANVFDFQKEPDYSDIINAIKTRKNFLYTIEFFPEEGKYHFDGHRACGVRLEPSQTKKEKGLCPKCHKPLTVGVLYRVEELSDRTQPQKPETAPDYKSLIPLKEIIAETEGVAKTSKKVDYLYQDLIKKGGSEFKILIDLSREEIEKIAGSRLAQAIIKMRKGEVYKEAGYDGVYGRIKIFSKPGRMTGQPELMPAQSSKKVKSRQLSNQKTLF